MPDSKIENPLRRKEASWMGRLSTVEEDCNEERTEKEEGEVSDSSVEESSFSLKHGKELDISMPVAFDEGRDFERLENRRKDREGKVFCKDNRKVFSRKSVEVVKIVNNCRRRRSSLLGRMQGKLSSVAKYIQSPKRIFGRKICYNLNSTQNSAKKKRISLMISSSDSPRSIVRKVKEKQQERKPWSSVLTPKKEMSLDRDSSIAVPDTNIFLHKLNMLRRMVELSKNSKIIFVPMVIHRELDGLKKNRDPEIVRLARMAVCWLNRELRGKMVVGQGLGEETVAIDMFRDEVRQRVQEGVHSTQICNNRHKSNAKHFFF